MSCCKLHQPQRTVRILQPPTSINIFLEQGRSWQQAKQQINATIRCSKPAGTAAHSVGSVRKASSLTLKRRSVSGTSLASARHRAKPSNCNTWLTCKHTHYQHWTGSALHVASVSSVSSVSSISIVSAVSIVGITRVVSDINMGVALLCTT